MDSADQLSSGPKPVAATGTLVLANPDDLKKGFAGLIDGIITETSDYLVDWGTIQFASRRVIDTKDGTEMIQIVMMVGVLGGEFDA